MTPVTTFPRDRQSPSVGRFVPLMATFALAAIPMETFSDEARRPVEAPAPSIIALNDGVEKPAETVAARTAPESPIRNIAEIVSRRLAAGDLGNYAIDVTVVDGVATLVGQVADPESKRRAVRITEQVDGVRSIDNRLTTSRHDNGGNHGRQTREGETAARGMKKPDRQRPTITVTVTVNVNSGNVFGHTGSPTKHDRDGDRHSDAIRERDAQIERLSRELNELRAQLGVPGRREQTERRSRETRDRFEQMRREALRRFEEIRRERDERARQQKAEDAAERKTDEPADPAAGEDPSDPETNAEPRSSQTPTPVDNLAKFVTRLFE